MENRKIFTFKIIQYRDNKINSLACAVKVNALCVEGK